MIERILVPVDGSECSNRAVELGSELAEKFDAKLVFVQVLLTGHIPDHIRNLSDKPGREEPAIAVGAAYVESSLPREVLSDISKKLLERARETAQSHGVATEGETGVETVSCTGDITESILEQASAYHVDTIVMGSRGLSNLKILLIGSVSHKVSHLFEGTLITVK